MLRTNFSRTNLVVEGSEGDLGALVLGNHNLDLYCRTREGNGVGAAADWRHSRTVPLPKRQTFDYSTAGAADGSCSYRLAHSSTPLLQTQDATKNSVLLTEAQDIGV